MGRMGEAMARRIAAAGHGLVIWNRTRAVADEVASSLEGRARVAASAAEAVATADVVLSMLADGRSTCSVLLHDAVLAAYRPGVVVCDLATSGPQAARELAERLGEAGFAFVDAPVSGSVSAVAGGTLLVMAAGEPGDIEILAPVLGSFARKVVRVGDPGAGQAMKLAVNLIVHGLNSSLSEALVMATTAGVTRDEAYDVFQESVIAAPFVNYKRGAFTDETTPVAMSLALVLKDLGLITDFAADAKVPITATEAVRDQVRQACEAGFGERDMAALSWFLGLNVAQ